MHHVFQMRKVFRGAIAVGALWACTAQAATYYFKPMNTDSGKPNQDASNKSGFTEAEWFTSTEYTGEPVAATADNDYIVTTYTMRTPVTGSGDVTFVGDSLQIGIVGGDSGTVVYSGASDAAGGFTASIERYKKLIFAKGSYSSWRQGISRVYGPVEVTATKKSPFLIINGGSSTDVGHCFYGAFTGGEDTGLQIKSSSGFGYRMIFAGDMSGYNGVITVYNTTKTGDGTNVTLCATSDAKTLHNVTMQKGTSLRAWEATDAFAIDSLTVADGCRLVVPIDLTAGKAGKISVASLSSVSEEQPLKVVFELSGVSSNEALTLPVLEFKDETASITTNCFVLPDAVSTIKYFDLPHISWEIVDKEGSVGVRQLVVKVKPIAYLKKSDTILYNVSLPVDSSMTNATAWTIDGVPHEGVDYAVTNQSFYLNTQYSSKKDWTQVFAGDSLTLGYPTKGVQLNMYCYKFESKGPVTFLPGSSYVFHLGGSGTKTFTAPEVRIGGTLSTSWVNFECYFNSLGILNAPLTGSGTLHVQGRDSSGSPMGGLALVGDNSKFGGRFYVYIKNCIKSGVLNGPDEDRYIWLQVSEANQLGGPVPGYTETAPCFNALELSNYSGLVTTNDITLAEPTRGAYINTYGRFVVSNSTLRLNQQLTLNGTCRVQGGGTLALGGAIKFTDKATDTPVALSNVIAVVEGGLEFAGENAVNGAAISFAAGTKLAVRPGMASTGALLTKELSDVTLPDGVESMPCEIDVSGIDEPNGPQFEVPLWTVSSSLAPTMRKFTVKKPWKGWRVAVRETANADGSITFTADCLHVGMVMFVQ